MLPHLQSLADVRARLEEAEQAVPLAQAAFNIASQKAAAMHEQLDVIRQQIEEAIQCRNQATERVTLLKTEIAHLEGQIESHSSLTGQENECPVCAQVLNETTFHHVQEKLKDECTDLEQKRTELATQSQPALERADNLIEQLKDAQIEQSEKSKAADAGEEKERNKLTKATTQLETARTNLTRTQEVLLAETPSLAEYISEINHTWVANERTDVTAALPAAKEATQKLQKVQDTYREAHARVMALREQRDPSAEPLGDHRANDEIAILVQEATTEAKICQNRVVKIGQEHTNLTRQATKQAATCASLAERASQGQQ